MLEAHRSLLDALAAELIAHETVDGRQLDDLLAAQSPPDMAIGAGSRRRIRRRVWPRVLLSGLVVLIVLSYALSITENPNYVPSVLLLGSFLVPVTLVTYLYEREPAGEMPAPTIVLCFLWGGAIGTMIAGVVEYDTLQHLGVFTLLGVGVIEEFAKLVVPLVIFLRGRYRTEAAGQRIADLFAGVVG